MTITLRGARFHQILKLQVLVLTLSISPESPDRGLFDKTRWNQYGSVERVSAGSSIICTGHEA